MAETAVRIRARLDKGLIPAVPAFFNDRGEYQPETQEIYARYMAAQPVAGVAVWAHTGRGLKLETKTAHQVLASWRAALPDKVLIAGAGADVSGGTAHEKATLASLQMAERAARCGADALLIYPPTWLRNHPGMDAMIVEHHRRLARMGLPLVLFYLYEAAGGINYSLAVLNELLAMPEVIGIKMATLDSVMTYQNVSRQIAQRHPEKLLLTGEDRFLGYSLRRGARSALIGMGAVCTTLQADLIRAHFAEDTKRFLNLSDQIDQLAEFTFIVPMEGYIQRLLWVLAHQGVIPVEAAHDPWGPMLGRREYDEIGRMLTRVEELQK